MGRVVVLMCAALVLGTAAAANMNSGTGGSSNANNNPSSSSTPTASSEPNGTSNGNTTTTGNVNGNGGSSTGTSGNQRPSPETSQPTTTTAQPAVVATLTDPGPGVLVHRYNGTTVQGYPGQPLRSGEFVEVIGPPGQPSSADTATIDWLAGGQSQLYDAKPQRYFPGQGVTRVHTQVVVTSSAPQSAAARVLSGIMSTVWPPSEPYHFQFEASTTTVNVAIKGTNFAVGYDPATKTGSVSVIQDSVAVTPTNPSLKPFTLTAGNRVEVTGNQVGPITPLAGTAPTPTTQPAKSSAGSSLGLIIGIIVGVLVLGALVFLLLVLLRRRGARAKGAPEAAPVTAAATGKPPTQPATPAESSALPTQQTGTRGQPAHRHPADGRRGRLDTDPPGT